MTEHRDPDHLIAAYFAQHAPDLPDRAFDAVRRDIHGTRQRRILWPWRGPDAPVVARALPVAAAILLIVSLWLVSLPGVGPGGAPSSPVPTPPRFRSPLYGYSIVVPDGWSATPAAVRWDGESQPSLGPNVDQFSGRHLVAFGYAGPFEGNLAAFVQDRMAATARDHADTCPPDALRLDESISIGGQPAVFLELNCGALIDQAITVHAGVGYAFTIRDLTFKPALDPTELASFRSMLDSVSFPTTPTKSP